MVVYSVDTGLRQIACKVLLQITCNCKVTVCGLTVDEMQTCDNLFEGLLDLPSLAPWTDHYHIEQPLGAWHRQEVVDFRLALER